jgi:hypothetical protein
MDWLNDIELSLSRAIHAALTNGTVLRTHHRIIDVPETSVILLCNCFNLLMVLKLMPINQLLRICRESSKQQLSSTRRNVFVCLWCSNQQTGWSRTPGPICVPWMVKDSKFLTVMIFGPFTNNFMKTHVKFLDPKLSFLTSSLQHDVVIQNHFSCAASL